MTITTSQLENLYDFQHYADQEQFEQIFGSAPGEYLWSQFQRQNNNLLTFCLWLDANHTMLLLNYLNRLYA